VVGKPMMKLSGNCVLQVWLCKTHQSPPPPLFAPELLPLEPELPLVVVVAVVWPLPF
jgi:hypothetical protein